VLFYLILNDNFLMSLYRIILLFQILILFSCGTDSENKAAKSKFNQGVKFFRDSEYGRAITSFSEAILIDSGYFQAYNNRGLSYAMLDQSNSALNDYDQAISLNPDFEDARKNRIRLLMEMEKYSEAEIDAQYFSNKYSDSAFYQYLSGLVYLKTGNYPIAIQYFTQAVRLDSFLLDAYINRSSAFYLLGNKMGAQIDVEYVLTIDDKNAKAYNNLAIAQAERGFYDDAQLSILEALKLEPGNFDFANNYVFILLMRGKAEVAGHIIDSLNSIVNNSAPYLQLNKGFYLIKNGNYKQSREVISRVLIESPKIERANYLMAISYEREKRLDSACYYFEKAYARQEFDSKSRLDSLCHKK